MYPFVINFGNTTSILFISFGVAVSMFLRTSVRIDSHCLSSAVFFAFNSIGGGDCKNCKTSFLAIFVLIISDKFLLCTKNSYSHKVTTPTPCNTIIATIIITNIRVVIRHCRLFQIIVSKQNKIDCH